MLSCCSCFTSDDQHDDYIPLPMSPTTAAANGGALPDQHELLLVSKQSGSPVNLLLLDEGLVVTRRKQSECLAATAVLCMPFACARAELTVRFNPPPQTRWDRLLHP